MPQNTGPGSPSVLGVLKTIFEQGVRTDINTRVPAWAAFAREGTKMPTRAKTHRFAIKGNIGNTARVYGENDPCTGFAQCDVPPEYCTVDINYKKIYVPYRVCNEVIQEAGTEGAMFDVLEQDLDDLVEQLVHLYERSIFTGDGGNVLFTLADAGTDNGDGTFTYLVQWYGGLEAEELGVIMENLLLRNLHIQAAAALDGLPRANPGVQITAFDSTMGTESITTEGTLGPVVIGDIVYPSREDTGGVQGSDEGLTGLPLLVDDWSRADPFQSVTEDDCPSFSSRICDNGGELRPLTEDILEQALAMAHARMAGTRKDSLSFQRHAFFANEFVARRFALELTADRRFSAPNMFSKKGLKPMGGVDMEFLTYDGIPFITSPLALRNTVFLVDLANLVIVHNGPPEGQFLSAPGGPTVERVMCTPTFEYVWWAYMDFATRRRNGMVQIRDIAGMDECPPAT